MPELAEVETVKRYLEKHILDTKIIKFKKFRDNLRYVLDSNLAEKIEKSKIINLRRRAKYLLLDLCNENSIIVHLGMSGRFTIQESNYLKQKHDHIVMWLQDEKQLVLNDTRRFGMFYCVSTNTIDTEPFIKHLGLEPLGKEFNFTYLKDKIKDKNKTIKNCIMDNSIVVGVGNIYATESLFAAKIHPKRSAASLKDNEISILVDKIKIILQKAIIAGGTTLRDFVSGDNTPGYFKQELAVYGRAQEPCNVCSSNIESINQSGRRSFFCPNCQI